MEIKDYEAELVSELEKNPDLDVTQWTKDNLLYTDEDESCIAFKSNSIRAQYVTMQELFSDYKHIGKRLQFDGDKRYDVHQLEKGGQQFNLRFDITSFFGKSFK